MKDSEIIGKHFHFNNDSFDNPIPCGLMNLYQMGELCCERGYVVEPHSQACHEISYIVSGKGFFFVDGERIPVSEGDLIFNNKNCIHAIEADKDSMLRYLYMGFDFRGQAEGQNVQELFDYYNQKNYFCKKDQNDIYIPFARGIDEFSTRSPFHDLMIKNYCQQILVLAFRDIQQSGEYLLHKDRSDNALGHLAYTLIKYIENNIYDIKSIREISEKMGYSYTYLSHFFSDHTGMSMQRYINLKKIEKAMELLKYSDLTVTQVAEKLHYETVQSFSKAFRKNMGFPPSQYVKMERQNDG